MITIHNADSLELLPQLDKFKMGFADPPDNIGLKYATYEDNLAEEEYGEFLRRIIIAGSEHCDIFWLSYNPNHMALIGHILYTEKIKARHFIQDISFGYYMSGDFGRCFRPMIRIMKPGVETYPDSIRIKSRRQELGDKRANPNGKIPGDLWTIHRVTGNSHQRRSWIDTQLHEDLYTRCIKFSTKPGDRIVDMFAGSGTMGRCEGSKGREVHLIEKCPTYCDYLRKEFNV